MAESVYQFHCSDGSGRDSTLEPYRGQVLLIVNTASRCGFTPQFAGLETLYEQYRERGFTILGFPCNQFGRQDPGSNAEIQEFCQLNYGVSFPMFGKIEVNGAGAAPLFQHLKQAAPGTLGNRIKWNFTKFLLNREGDVVKRYGPATKPAAIATDIEALL